MVNHQRSQWIIKRWLLAFCFLIVCPAMGIDVCSASLLKDIRIGEHSEFTRIVFVFDVQPSDSRIEAISAKKVRITIESAKPDLMRKIEFKKNRNIEDIRIVTGREQLTSILSLNLAHTKVSSFQMKKPPRLVFDIFWQTSGATATKPVTTQYPAAKTQSKELSTNEPGPVQVATTEPLSETAVPAPAKNATPSTLPVESGNALLEAPPPTPTSGSEKGSTANVAQAPAETTVAEKPRPSDLPVDRAQPSQQASNWLQYYLVVALVIMTIAILFLLVLMLLSKYRLTNNTAHLSANEYLKRQDKHLSSLDDRIKEQLKRYDEA